MVLNIQVLDLKSGLFTEVTPTEIYELNLCLFQYKIQVDDVRAGRFSTRVLC